MMKFFFFVLFAVASLQTESKAATTVQVQLNGQPVNVAPKSTSQITVTVKSNTAWNQGQASLYYFYVTPDNNRFGPADKAVTLHSVSQNGSVSVNLNLDTTTVPSGLSSFGVITYIVLDGRIVGPGANGQLLEFKISGRTTQPQTCNPTTQPSPHWGEKNGQCLMSCGGLGGTQSFGDSCTNHDMIDAGSAYDVGNCCKLSHQGPTPQPPKGGTNFTDLVMAGYQGWFRAVGGQGASAWAHWSIGFAPQPGAVKFELYPDLRDYSSRDLFDTNLGPLRNGSPSKLFSSGQDGVVATHFQWMSQYGIDGVALQRFVSELIPGPSLQFRDLITEKVRRNAEAYQKKFYIMYDVSGANPSTVISDIKNDWVGDMENNMNITKSSSYARQDGRPVIGLWGFGFTDHPGSAQEVTSLIEWFKNRGFYVLGGVPYQWRTSNGGSQPGWLDTYTHYNMISPWTVGAITNDAQIDSDLEKMVKPDKSYCDQHGIQYQRVIFPGFAWSNWNGGQRNMIPRRAGQFMWHQAYAITGYSAGAYIAMFDEYDEGTAIAKAAENQSMVPAGQYFLSLDADGVSLSSDFYLRLSGAATQMIKGINAHSPTVPISPR